jgi:23S rRNA (guanosine2251-2'-O)-methyltransferase
LAGLLQSVEYPANVGSIFRLADGAGMAKLILSGITPTPPHPTIDKVGRFKSTKVPWEQIKDPVAAARQLKGEGYRLVAVELAETAVPYFEYDYPQKTCLVVGHEDHGVTKAVLGECDDAVFIPMFGKGSVAECAYGVWDCGVPYFADGRGGVLGVGWPAPSLGTRRTTEKQPSAVESHGEKTKKSPWSSLFSVVLRVPDVGVKYPITFPQHVQSSVATSALILYTKFILHAGYYNKTLGRVL